MKGVKKRDFMHTIVAEKITIVEVAIDEVMSLITGKSILTSREAGVQEEK